MLRHSGEALLAFRSIWYGHSWTIYELTDVLAPRLHRLRHLDAEILQSNTTAKFLRTWALSSPNPHLVSLRVWLTIPRRGCDNEACALLTSARAPNLRKFVCVLNRRLSFQGWSFTANLETLELYQVQRARTPAAGFYTLLASAPHLRELSLANILPDNPSPLSALTFLTLAKLDLQDTPARTTHFLDSIRTHALRHIHVDCPNKPEPAGGGALALPALAHALSSRLRDADDAPPFTSLEYGEDGLQMPVRVHTVLEAVGGTSVRRAEIVCRYSETDVSCIPSFLGGLPLGYVVQAELVIWGSGGRLPSAVARPDGQYAAWRTAFGRMRALEDLVVESRFWEFPEHHFLGRDGLRRFFPRLQSLHVGEQLVWPVLQALQPVREKNERR
ncbi:hypothetical protein PsYK624_122280 [Phanerochaete sordida]|uniref:F-box domain-containing protein n=1 Tax=Phanerochaete sordida TaxID=48140 RepID=A0A9P3GJ20_9APHY|nr:hypothetical protein PsYK624_122280 [Phanerochaete sordida]